MATLELSKNILKIKSKFLHIAVEFCLKVELRKNLIKQLKSVQNVCHQKNDSKVFWKINQPIKKQFLHQRNIFLNLNFQLPVSKKVIKIF